MRKSVIKSKFGLLNTVLLMFLILYVVSFVGLFFWAFINTFKEYMTPEKTGYFYDKVGFPNPFTLKNYESAFMHLSVTRGIKVFYIEDMYLNSLLYSVGSAFFGTFVPCIVAYMIAKYKFFFSKIVYLFIIVSMILPIVGSTPSAIEMARLFGLYNSIWGLWIMAANFMAGIYFLVFYDVFYALPTAYKEAAEIDGASQLKVMISIMLPLVKNVFFTVFLIKFIAYWNDYQTPLLYMPDHPTVAFGLVDFFFSSSNEYSTTPMKLTGAFLVAVPIAVVFIVFQKRIMGNLTAGGIKG